MYTEPYGQVDMTLGYNVDDHLSFSLDALNLNDGVIRQHSRTTEALEVHRADGPSLPGRRALQVLSA